MKLQQTSLDQTGVAILILKGNKEKLLPLYSTNPVEEANKLVKNYFPDCEVIKAVYFTNNLMPTKIEDVIEKYEERYGYLPENYVEELLSGFPYIIGEDYGNTTYFYL